MQYAQSHDYQPSLATNPGLPVLIPEKGGGYSDLADDTKLYGALLDSQLEARSRAQADKYSSRRLRVNCVPTLGSLLLPWLSFLGVFSVNSFYVHYAAPMTTTLATVVAIIIALVVTRGAMKNVAVTSEDRFFPVYMGVAMTLAIALGWFMGDLNFWSYMQPTYQEEHLATYNNVDPSSQQLWSREIVPTRGRRFQDAGKIYFKNDAVVDVSRAQSFKMRDLYCVAPIVNPQCKDSCGSDFWAVGMNCCSEDGSNFNCGDVHNPMAHSGLRLLAESKRALFRLAVMQSQATPSGQEAPATHPLFFLWVQDPVAEMMRWRKSGYRHFLEMMFMSFFANAVFLASTLNIWRKRLMYHGAL